MPRTLTITNPMRRITFSRIIGHPRAYTIIVDGARTDMSIVASYCYNSGDGLYECWCSLNPRTGNTGVCVGRTRRDAANWFADQSLAEEV